MANQNPIPIRSDTLNVLLNVVASRIAEYPVGDQIKIYQALAEALPNCEQKLQARELARVLSRAEALQLEFRRTMNN